MMYLFFSRSLCLPNFQIPSHQMLNLVHVQLNMRIHLQILIMCRMYLVFDVFLEIGHLHRDSHH